MPVDALAHASPPEDAPVRVRCRRIYRDPLGRPMAGKVRLTSGSTVVEGQVVIPPVPVDVTLVDGVLDVQLPAGHYSLVAQLTTVDGMNVVDKGDLDLTAP